MPSSMSSALKPSAGSISVASLTSTPSVSSLRLGPVLPRPPFHDRLLDEAYVRGRRRNGLAGPGAPVDVPQDGAHVGLVEGILTAGEGHRLDLGMAEQVLD